MTQTRRQTSPKVQRGEARRRELLTVAAKILLRDGLGGASMDQIAIEAGASKATLYRHFTDKHGLLTDVVQYLCADFISDVGTDPSPAMGLRGGLTDILNQLIHVLSKPDHPAFFRLIVAGAQVDPAIGQTWHEHGPLVWHTMLRRVFDTQRDLGNIPENADYSDFPEMLFDAIFSDVIVRTAVLGNEHNIYTPAGRYVSRLIDVVASALMIDHKQVEPITDHQTS